MTPEPRRIDSRRSAALGGVLVLVLAACSTDGGIPTIGPATQAAATQAPATSAPTSQPPATGAPAPSEPAASGPSLALDDHPTYGEYLTDQLGRSLYLFKPDEDNQSTCVEACATAWPPFLIEAGQTVAAGEGVTGAIGVIERADGGMQVTYEKQPLYYFSGDLEVGDTTGQGLQEVWYLVDVEGDSVSGDGRGSY